MSMTDQILGYAREYALSDLHICSGQPIAIRLGGEIEVFQDDIAPREEVEQFIKDRLSSELAETYAMYGDVDLSFEAEEYRFRANFYHTARGPAISLRRIEPVIPTIDSLNLPPVVHRELDADNGLILVTGPTGSGKSTTLAAMVDRINSRRRWKIITIEDPIEFVHRDRQCIISQREVGRDAYSFAYALRAALREDPDVILVGELRDRETILLALTAAETGHLVFSTVHTSGAANTINRILDACPGEQQSQVRAQLSQSLRLVITQKLLRRKDGVGRVAAFEVMTCNTAVQNLIRDNKVFQIPAVIQTARSEGMVTMETAIHELAAKGVI